MGYNVACAARLNLNKAWNEAEFRNGARITNWVSGSNTRAVSRWPGMGPASWIHRHGNQEQFAGLRCAYRRGETSSRPPWTYSQKQDYRRSASTSSTGTRRLSYSTAGSFPVFCHDARYSDLQRSSILVNSYRFPLWGTHCLAGYQVRRGMLHRIHGLYRYDWLHVARRAIRSHTPRGLHVHRSTARASEVQGLRYEHTQATSDFNVSGEY